MAADYLFLGTNVNLNLVTDASRGAKVFFVTEKQNEDSVDVMAGIDVEIEEVSEEMLKQIARDRSVSLYRTDFTGTRCLVLQANAGAFNGVTSNLQVDDVTIASAGVLLLPLTFRLTFRMSQSQIDALPMKRPAIVYLVSTDISISGSINLTLVAQRGTILLVGNVIFNSETSININHDLGSDFADMCQTIEMRIAQEGTNHMTTLIINEQEINSRLVESSVVVPRDDFTIVYGAVLQGTKKSRFFEGIMRSFLLTGSSGNIINIADPSTGTNSGSGDDGTVTDITQVTVIT